MNSCPLIPADWELPAVLRIRVGHGPGRQRILEAEDHLLLLLHDVPKHHDLAQFAARRGCSRFRSAPDQLRQGHRSPHRGSRKGAQQ